MITPTIRKTLRVATITLTLACNSGASDPWPWGYDRPPDGLLNTTTLQEIVNLQVQRNGQELAAYLDHRDATVRARAAFAMASVQDSAAIPRLVELLEDSDPRVRADAAFALGQFPESGQIGLLEAVYVESDPIARGRQLEALGKMGSIAAVAALVRTEIPAESDRWLATAFDRFAVRGLSRPRGVDWLMLHLKSPDPVLRNQSAYFFGLLPRAAPLRPSVDSIRAALDDYALGDLAAIHVLRGLSRIGSPDDADRITRRLREDTDWRVRATAAAALYSLGPLPQSIDALLTALDDESHHVAFNAAATLRRLSGIPRDELANVQTRVQEPELRPRVAGELLEALAIGGDPAVVIEWFESDNRTAEELAYAVGALAYVEGAAAFDALRRYAAAADEPVALAALRALEIRRRRALSSPDEPAIAYYEVFSDAAASGRIARVAVAAWPLGDSSFTRFGSADVLSNTYQELPETAIAARLAVLSALAATGGTTAELILEQAASTGHPQERAQAIQALAALGRTLEPPPAALAPTPPIDWDYLRRLGDYPRVRLDTRYGTMVLQLDSEQAPQTVQTFMRLVEEGRYDGTTFDRVLPNFAVEGGDVSKEQGLGGPGFLIRSEITRIPFATGVMGMANSGRDTEGSRFFLTHSGQPRLDGRYTAFGVLTEGLEVLWQIQQGDLLLSASILGGN